MSEYKTQDNARRKTQDTRHETAGSLKSLKSLNDLNDLNDLNVKRLGSSSIAMIGDRDSILGFKALGVEIFPVETKGESAEALREVIEQEYKVVFITEQMAPSSEELSSILGDRTFPVVTMIPSNRGSTGLAMQKLQTLVRKAAGADVL